MEISFQLKKEPIKKRLILVHLEIPDRVLDEGNKGYDLFESTTQPGVFLFCESWADKACLTRHARSEHFTRIVPELEKLTDGGLSIEQFER